MNRYLPFVMLILLLTAAACGPAAAPTAPPPSPTPAPPTPAIQSFFPADAAPPGAVVSLQGQHFGGEPGAVTFDVEGIPFWIPEGQMKIHGRSDENIENQLVTHEGKKGSDFFRECGQVLFGVC